MHLTALRRWAAATTAGLKLIPRAGGAGPDELRVRPVIPTADTILICDPAFRRRTADATTTPGLCNVVVVKTLSRRFGVFAACVDVLICPDQIPTYCTTSGATHRPRPGEHSEMAGHAVQRGSFAATPTCTASSWSVTAPSRHALLVPPDGDRHRPPRVAGSAASFRPKPPRRSADPLGETRRRMAAQAIRLPRECGGRDHRGRPAILPGEPNGPPGRCCRG
jgi:hypothetical protein